jgi:hypothetical protein
MNSIDPTTQALEEFAGYTGDLSVDDIQQIQAYEVATNAGASVHNGSHNGHTAVLAEVGAEPTLAHDTVAAAPPVEGPQPPIVIPVLLKRLVRGRYRSPASGFQVELRVDVDGSRTTRRVSADYYSVSGATVNYFGSMIVNTASIAVTATTVTITGTGAYTWAAGAPVVRITIPRVSILAPAGAATLRHLTTSGTPGATYVCAFESAFFRSVDIEEDIESGVARFASYDTGLLPSGGSARTLSVAASYAEAGIQMRISPNSNTVPTSESGANAIWSNAELHSAGRARLD